MIRSALFAAASLTIVAGCASTEIADDGAFYPSGFTDGCRTAESVQASFASESFRDQLLFDTEASYRAGFRAGLAQCRRADLDNRPGDMGEWETY